MDISKGKIAIITPSSGFGGGENWCLRFAAAAEAEMFEPILVPFVMAAEKRITSGVQVVYWRGWSHSTSSNLLHLREIIQSFDNSLNDIEPTIVVCATWPAALFCLYLKSRQRLPGKLLIVFHRQIQEVLFRSSWFNLLVPLKFSFFRRYLPLADKVVVLNESSREVLRRWIQIRPLVIPNGVNVEGIRLKSLEEIVSPVSSPYVAFIGRLEGEKGLECLVRAFKLIADNGTGLILLGEGSSETHLRSLVSDLGLVAKVHWGGYRENPFPLLREAAVLVVPSPWECQPLVVLEAFVLGVPVIGVDNPGMRELLGDGTRGLLCEGSTVSIASALREVLADGVAVARRVAAGKEYVENHDETMMMRKYLTVMEEMLR